MHGVTAKHLQQGQAIMSEQQAISMEVARQVFVQARLQPKIPKESVPSIGVEDM
jgi:hypothetical protein